MDYATLSSLHGNRVLLRPFSKSDITSTYISWLNDPAVVQFSNQRFLVHDYSSCNTYLSNFGGSPNIFFAIIDIKSQETIGTMTVYRSLQHETADLGIMIGNRSVWGQGYGKESFALLAESLITNPNIRKITAGCLSRNIGMVEVMKHAGLQIEATRYGQELLDGKPEDILYYARFHVAKS